VRLWSVRVAAASFRFPEGIAPLTALRPETL